jgi:Ni/Fe-hydrogenase subunit HybB-like protein
MVVGVILPIILFATPGVRRSKSGLFWTSLLVFAGTLINRMNATWVGQSLTASTWTLQSRTVEAATYTPSWIEIAIQVGVLAALAVAWYLIARFLPIFPEDVKESH